MTERVPPPSLPRSRAESRRRGTLAAAVLAVTLTILAAVLAGGPGTWTSRAVLRPAAPIAPAVLVPSAPRLQVQVVASPSDLILGNTTVLTALPAGGTPWYSFDWAPLPPGCATLNLSSLSCTPTTAGTYHPGVTVTDSAGQTVAATTGTPLYVNSSQTRGPTSGAGSLLSVPIYLFAGLVGIGAAVVSTLLILLLTRRRRRRQPPVPFSAHPYVPPRETDAR